MHEPVLLKEVVGLLEVGQGGTYIDGTLGGGGHAGAILDATGPRGKLLGIDRDPGALERARAHLADRLTQVHLIRGSFADMQDLVRPEGVAEVDGVLLDLGVSSEQLAAPERGFSFLHDGPLDMRADPSQERTAAVIVNGLAERDLSRLLWELGEERRANRIARQIVRERERAPLRTTGQLADLVSRAVGGRRGPLHPATKTFQALRMAVNEEMDQLARGLDAGLSLLAEGGRMAVISFHSLEDRLVKRFFVSHAGRWESLPAGGRQWCGERPKVRLVTRKPVTPSGEEMERNPRSRSAKLRVAERVAWS